ncbi:DUF7691 family protein [Streptomyces thermoviolaceus]|uniref:DUF7691 family protein n=1 Tax=Streptomyces thermoviolaceus TaxID=1952 RepID=UPI003B8A8B20
MDSNASDPADLSVYSKPATFFGLLDQELSRAGVPAGLLPGRYLYGGLPPEFPFLPCSVDGYPAIGHLTLSEAGPAADAYRAVLDRIDPDFRYDLGILIEKLEFEHDEWVTCTRDLDWYSQDTIFFSLT